MAEQAHDDMAEDIIRRVMQQSRGRISGKGIAEQARTASGPIADKVAKAVVAAKERAREANKGK